MRIIDTLVIGLPALLLTRCSSPNDAVFVEAGSQTDGMVSPDAAADETAGSDANPADTTQTCNTLDLGAAQPISLNQVASDEPVATGGTIFDGTYLLTKWTTYTGPGGATGPLPLAIRVRRDFGMGTVQTIEDDGARVQHLTSLLTTSDTSFTETDTCPGATVDRGTYTATSGTITEWVSDHNQIVESVFTKQ